MPHWSADDPTLLANLPGKEVDASHKRRPPGVTLWPLGCLLKEVLRAIARRITCLLPLFAVWSSKFLLLPPEKKVDLFHGGPSLAQLQAYVGLPNRCVFRIVFLPQPGSSALDPEAQPHRTAIELCKAEGNALSSHGLRWLFWRSLNESGI